MHNYGSLCWCDLEGLSNHYCERREGLGTERSVFKYVLYNLAISLDDQKSDIYAVPLGQSTAT